MRLEPFNLSGTEDYLNSKQIFLTKKQVVDVYMATGGVAKYLSYVRRGQSSAQTIQHLCFSENSPLMDEYDNLYSSLFTNFHDHIAIVEALAKKRSGLTHTQLLNITGKKSGGSFTRVLKELKETGFMDEIQDFNKKNKGQKILPL